LAWCCPSGSEPVGALEKILLIDGVQSEKTRLLEFGRYAEERAKRQGRKKPGTFDFLGLTHICARSRRGKFTVHVGTMRKRLRRSLTAVAEWCQEHRHAQVDEQQKTPQRQATADRQTLRAF
jgi:hypothetical protein